jgi:hypothetical protein
MPDPSRQIRLIVWGHYWTWSRRRLVDRGVTEREWFPLIGVEVDR